jgi:hypothetical protein
MLTFTKSKCLTQGPFYWLPLSFTIVLLKKNNKQENYVAKRAFGFITGS